MNDYTQAQVPAILRGIYAYHVTGRGWRDIGYNFLIDRFGNTWEGRAGGVDRPVVGAQASGVNEHTFGVSVLGDFTATVPPSEVIAALSSLIAWKAGVHSFALLGRTKIGSVTYDNVSGHRDVNQTTCPGQYLYTALPAIRQGALAKAAPARRVGAADRYSTAAALSATTFEPGAPVVFVATGKDFPDALAAGPAGGLLKGPVLLTAKSALPAATTKELERLKPQRIIVLGGSGVVAKSVFTQLNKYSRVVSRVAGADRYATAAAVSAQTFPPESPVAFIATGRDFPDALAAGPAGGRAQGPVLLSDTNSLPAATQKELIRLKPKRIVILGGIGVVSSEVAQQLTTFSADVSRQAGADRYATAATTSAKAFGRNVPVVYVATGLDFPDALAAGPVGGVRGGPVLLTMTDTVPESTIAELQRLAPQHIIVLGGTGAVSARVAQRLSGYEKSH